MLVFQLMNENRPVLPEQLVLGLSTEIEERKKLRDISNDLLLKAGINYALSLMFVVIGESLNIFNSSNTFNPSPEALFLALGSGVTIADIWNLRNKSNPSDSKS